MERRVHGIRIYSGIVNLRCPLGRGDPGWLPLPGERDAATGYSEDFEGRGRYCVAALQGLAAWIRPQPNTGSLPGAPRSIAVAASIAAIRVGSETPARAMRAPIAAVT